MDFCPVFRLHLSVGSWGKGAEGYLQPAEAEEGSVRKWNRKAAWNKTTLP